MAQADRRSVAEAHFDLPAGAFPFESRFMAVGKARFHYIREGRGPTLVFVHGNPTWSFLYRRIIHALRTDYECIALDLPGFGLSRPPPHYGFTPKEHADLVAQFLIEADVRRSCLVAHDWGGPIGLWAMFNTGDRLASFCLGNSWAWPVNGIIHFEWFARLMGGPIGQWANERHAVFVNRVIPLSMKRGRPDDTVMRAYRAPFEPPALRRPLHVFPRHILRSKRWLADIERNLETFTGPAALIWPENDIAFREQELEKWRRILPRARVTKIANCGHYLWEDACDDALAALQSHLGQLTRSG